MSINYFFKLCYFVSVKGSVLILVILFIQKFFKRDFTSKWIYLLWIIAVIRLLLPQGPLTNVLSLYNLGLYKRYTFSIKDIIIGKSVLTSNSFKFIDSDYNVTNLVSDSLSFKWTNYLGVMWLIGVAILTIAFLVLNFVFFKNLHKKNITDNKQINDLLKNGLNRLNLKRNIKIYSTSRLKTPFTYGIFKPKIIIPDYMLTNFQEDQLKYIIFHELVHIKHFDNFYNFLGAVACIIHWYNSFAWYIYFRLKKDCELACDERVLLLLNTEDYIKYGKTLIEVMQTNATNNYNKTIINKAFINDRREANERILQISRFKPKRKSILLISTIFLVLVIFISFTEDQSARPLTLNRNISISACLNMTKHELNTIVKQNPIHAYFLTSNENPYYILYYNINGIHYQFWYDAITYHGDLKPVEITTTKYNNIYRGQKVNEAILRATELFGEPVSKKNANNMKQYVYQKGDYKIMLIADDKTEKIYSITFFRG